MSLLNPVYLKKIKLVDSFKQIKKDQNILSKRSNDANLASLKSFKECTHLKFLTFHRFKLLKHIKRIKKRPNDFETRRAQGSGLAASVFDLED